MSRAGSIESGFVSSGDRIRERFEGVRARGEGFDPSRIGPGVRVSAISGALLAILMLFTWFGGESAWQLRLVDLLLLVAALGAIGLALAAALGREPGGPLTAGLGLTVVGAVALGIMLTLVLESTGGTVPLVLSLLAAGGLLYGGLTALTGGGGGAPPRAARPGAVQGAGEGTVGGGEPGAGESETDRA
ncbi:MAG TPA: hypothetical protein VGR10_05115 [Thermoleophilaceae bacterium]|nr:hypothetical protein [Thermoleophilaceae bacterium]